MSRRKLSAPQGRWNRCGSFDDCWTNARCMGPEKPADAISNPRISALRADGHNRSLCIDILTCHDETICAIIVIHLNLNPSFKNPRSATAPEWSSQVSCDYVLQMYYMSGSIAMRAWIMTGGTPHRHCSSQETMETMFGLPWSICQYVMT